MLWSSFSGKNMENRFVYGRIQACEPCSQLATRIQVREKIYMTSTNMIAVVEMGRTQRDLRNSKRKEKSKR